MGLDMYLYRKHYVKNWDFAPKQYDITVKTKTGKDLPGLNRENIIYVIEEVMYWRKANAIHNWFVNNVQDGIDDCGTYEFDIDALQELLVACEVELKNKDNKVEDEDGLTPTSGFFFGSTTKDEWYYQTLENTVKTLKEIIKVDEESEHEIEYEYRASW